MTIDQLQKFRGVEDTALSEVIGSSHLTSPISFTYNEHPRATSMVSVGFVQFHEEFFPFLVERQLKWRPPINELVSSEANVVRVSENITGVSLLIHESEFAVCLLASPEGIQLSVAATSMAVATEIADDYEQRSRPPLGPSDFPMVRWRHARKWGDTGIATSLVQQAEPVENVLANYPAEVGEELHHLAGLTDLEGISGRLIVFCGPPGTGKTHAIKSLAKSWEHWAELHLVSEIATLLDIPPYFDQVIHGASREHIPRTVPSTDFVKRRLIAAEDADQFVETRNGEHVRHKIAQGMSELLNACDGLAGETQEALMLVTTNLAITQIDPAILRPGRCLKVIEFRPFSQAEAREWLGPEAGAIKGERTLAQLYEMRTTGRDEVGEAQAKEFRFGTYL